MSTVDIVGVGAVSPAGWGMAALEQALQQNIPLAPKELARPGLPALQVRQVPPPQTRLPYLAHPRFRRSSPIAQYCIGAALEALGTDAEAVKEGKIRLGIVLAAMSGCVNYSRRFYDETLKDPATASPLVFPETVFNAPASHIAAFLSSTAINYTLVGDPGTFLQSLAVAAQWLEEDRVDGCLVIGAEESDWLTSTAFRLFIRRIILSDGAGVLYLKKNQSSGLARLHSITSPRLFSSMSRSAAAVAVRQELPPGNPTDLLCDGLMGLSKLDWAEEEAWKDWNGQRLSVKTILGEALMASSAWQCCVAAKALAQQKATSATVPVVGCNEQAIAARFIPIS